MYSLALKKHFTLINKDTANLIYYAQQISTITNTTKVIQIYTLKKCISILFHGFI